MTHTQTPWKAIEQRDGCCYITEGDNVICDLYYDSTPDDYIGFGREFAPYENGKEHADLICRAVNSHDVLVSALELIARQGAGTAIDEPWAAEKALEALAALKLAKGE